MNLDQNIFWQINQLAGKSSIIDSIAIFLASRLEFVLIFMLGLMVAYNFKKYFWITIKAFAAAGLARLVIVNIIRHVLPRLRPFMVERVNLLIPPPDELSFPSGHAAFYFALSTVVYFYNKKAGIFFYISSLFIVIARIFVGIHWPSDILAGIIVGIFSGWLILRLSRKIFSAAS